MKRRHRFLAALLCLPLSAAVAAAGGPTSVAEEEAAMNYRSVELLPNTDSETPFLFSGGKVQPFGTAWFRFADRTNQFLYRFEGEKGQTAFLEMELGHEYRVEVSPDRTQWEQVLCYRENGRYREKRAVDLTPWFADSTTVFVRFTDAEPADGWGVCLYKARYVAVTGAGKSLPAWQDVSSGWVDGTGARVAAGQPLMAEPGSQVTLSRYIALSPAWTGEAVALSIPWVRSAAPPVVKVAGQTVSSLVDWGSQLVVPLPESGTGRVTVSVTLTADEEGLCGLYANARAGFAAGLMMNEAVWTLGDDARRMYRQYADVDGADLVGLNALAGNYLTTLYDGRYSLNGFDGRAWERGLFYVHDTARALIAFADEERFSPVVRLDAVVDCYRGVTQARVPGSDYELFLKQDARPKQVMTGAADPAALRLATNQDNVEIFADLAVRDGVGGKPTGYDHAETDGGLTRTYAFGGGTLRLEAAWPEGTSDKPTALTAAADGMDRYALRLENFKSAAGYGPTVRPWSFASAGDGWVAFNGTTEVTEIAPPAEGYVILHSVESVLADALVVTWDTPPAALRFHGTGGGSFAALELVYDGAARPTVVALPVYECDGNLTWPRRLAENLVKTGRYGSNGYDPSYLCGTEGLGPGGLAAAAYVLTKYEHPLAAQARTLALAAMQAAEEAAERGVVPDCFNDRLAACGYLAALGQEEWRQKADEWGQRALRQQLPNGAFPWFDGRRVLALQRAWDVTALPVYREAVDRYASTIAYYPDRIEYDGKTLTGHQLFLGGTDLAWLGYDGDAANVKQVFGFADHCIDDTGVFDCSDIDPYFLGWSLAGTMEKTYAPTDKKTVIGRRQGVLYTAAGEVTVLDHPTACVHNPYRFAPSVRQTVGDVSGDGAVNAADALLALQQSVRLTDLDPVPTLAADVNGDGAVNAADALLILQKSVKLVDKFPAE